MPVYTVHAPRSAGRSAIEATDRVVFVRDGFHFWAFVAGLIWLIWHRLWWGLLGYVVISAVGDIIMSALHVGIGARFLVMVLFALLMGFEAASLQRWTLSRGKWRQIGYVVADDAESAEHRFFEQWTGRSAGEASSIDRGAPPPTRFASGQAFSRPPSGSHEGIIGLFPTPGASR